MNARCPIPDRRGSAYERLIETHRAELEAHCQRLVGSADDAEDAVQEALLRAWKGWPGFEGRSSVRSWLYRIATNCALDEIARRPGWVLSEAWAEGADQGSPDARYERRESVELAFAAAGQLLPPNQRAALIFRELLGFSARETAAALGTSVAAANSALQRARAAISRSLPAQDEQALRSVEDECLREKVKRCADAWERSDVEAVVALLAK